METDEILLALWFIRSEVFKCRKCGNIQTIILKQYNIHKQICITTTVV
jgi:hypothetical protein